MDDFIEIFNISFPNQIKIYAFPFVTIVIFIHHFHYRKKKFSAFQIKINYIKSMCQYNLQNKLVANETPKSRLRQ